MSRASRRKLSHGVFASNFKGWKARADLACGSQLDLVLLESSNLDTTLLEFVPGVRKLQLDVFNLLLHLGCHLLVDLALCLLDLLIRQSELGPQTVEKNGVTSLTTWPSTRV